MYELKNGMQEIDETILAQGHAVPTWTWLTGVNNNLLVQGSSGSGKTESVIKPNLMQLSSSYVVIDPKGSLHDSLAPGLAEAGYDVALVDLSDPSRSTASWDPVASCAGEAELHELGTALFTEHGFSRHDAFWQETAAMAFVAVVHLIRERGEAPTLPRVIEMLGLAYEPAPEGSRPPEGFPCERPYGSKDFSALDELFSKAACDVTEAERKKAIAAEKAIKDELNRLTKAHARLVRRHVGLRNEIVERFHLGWDEYRSYRTGAARADDPALRRALREQARRSAERGEVERRIEEVRLCLGESAGPTRGQMDSSRRPGRRRPRPGGSEAYDRWVHCRASAEKTWKSILVSTSPALDRWRDPALDALLRGEGLPRLDLEAPGRRPTAAFVVVSDTSRDRDLLAGLLVRQLVSALVRMADGCANRRLPQPVRVVFDDFANMSPWPDFDTWVAAVRSREIWLTVAIQSMAQLRSRYGLAADTIVANCDQRVFFVPIDLPQARELSELTGRDPRRLMAMGADRVWVSVRSHEPEAARRYDVREHPNYVCFESARARAGERGTD